MRFRVRREANRRDNSALLIEARTVPAAGFPRGARGRREELLLVLSRSSRAAGHFSANEIFQVPNLIAEII